MTILDGKKISKQIISSLKDEFKKYNAKLVVILVGENAASLIYVKNKEKVCKLVGVKYEEHRFSNKIKQEDLLNEIKKLNNDKTVTGFMVQLPLPKHIQVSEVIKAINPKKDVDGFHNCNIGKMFIDENSNDLLPATPLGIIKLLDAYNIAIEGKEVVVVGRSNIVGKPISSMMLNRNATVTTCHSYTKNLAEHTKRADILISAVGKRNLIKEDMVKDGVVIVDVAMNRKEDGSICGDVDFDKIKNKASFISPVPGGVGPMTIVSLFRNILQASKNSDNSL